MDEHHLVDHLARRFWEAHSPEMLKHAEQMDKNWRKRRTIDDNETIKEAVRVGIRAVLLELTKLSSSPA